jgi:hypothetical protein
MKSARRPSVGVLVIGLAVCGVTDTRPLLPEPAARPQPPGDIQGIDVSHLKKLTLP